MRSTSGTWRLRTVYIAFTTTAASRARPLTSQGTTDTLPQVQTREWLTFTGKKFSSVLRQLYIILLLRCVSQKSTLLQRVQFSFNACRKNSFSGLFRLVCLLSLVFFYFNSVGKCMFKIDKNNFSFLMTDALIWQTRLVPNRKRSFSTWRPPWPPSSLIQPPKFCPWRPRRLTTPSRCSTFLRCRCSPIFPASTSTSRGLTASTSPSTEDTIASETIEERPICSGKVQFFTCFIWQWFC